MVAQVRGRKKGLSPPGGSTGRSSDTSDLSFSGLYEIQDVSVEITNAELSSTVERTFEVLFELDSFVIAWLADESGLRGRELPGFEKVLDFVDLAGIKP
jgi:hypothetical protein